MKTIAAILCFAPLSAMATDIDLKQRVVTFTNLEGRAFENVRLSLANNNGVVYLNDNGGGLVCYTNLSLGQLSAWNLSTNLPQAFLDRKERARQARIQAELDRQHQEELIRQANERARRAAEEYRRTNTEPEIRGRPFPTPRNRIGLGE